MKQLVIIGSGGMGRQLFSLAHNCVGYGSEFLIKGFLDDNPHAMDGFSGYPPILGSISDYIIQPDDVFAVSIGNVQTKKNCVKRIQDKGGIFINLIEKTANISPNVKIGIGCIVTAGARIGVDTVIGDFSFIQTYAIVGHDVVIGSNVRIDCNVVLIEGVVVGDNVCIHTSSVINHKVKIGNDATIGALSFVIRNVKQGTTVFGNPAKKIE